MILLSFKCDQVSDLGQQLELTSELDSNLREVVSWGRRRLNNFNAAKTQLASFDCLHGDSAIDSLAKIASKNVEVLIRSMRFLFSEVAIYLSYRLTWNTVSMSGLVLLVAA